MKKAFLFPGQGSQYPGMGKDFIQAYAIAKETFEEADDVLKRNISSIILEGPEDLLTETKNSQIAIFIVSVAIWRVVYQLFPHLLPDYCAGLSLGEYTALTAAGFLSFEEGLKLVQYRGNCMNEACENTKGSMAVILGLQAEEVQKIVEKAELPSDLWVANFNSPGQVVISGTLRGIETGIRLAKEYGAKRALPLQVHGAFHSGLMESAREKLKGAIEESSFLKGQAALVMNVTGGVVQELSEIRKNLIEQVTSSVRWESGIRFLNQASVELYIEMGPGKTLAGFNKRIEVSGKTISIEKVEDLKTLEMV